VDLGLAFAGLGILMAIGLVPGRSSAVLGSLGLAYMTGVAVVPTVLAILLVVGIPFTLVTFLFVVAACVLLSEIGAGGRGANRSSRSRWRLPPWRSWSPTTWLIAAFVGIFAVFAVIGMSSATKMPLDQWDAWSIWARKAQILTDNDSLVGGFFDQPSYDFAHLDYPLNFPIWEALHFRAAGTFDTQSLLRHVWLLFIAFGWGVAYLVRERVPAVVWAPVLLLVAAAPGVWQQLLSGYADVPMAMLACIGAISLGFWLAEGSRAHLALGAVMLAATANMKNEGLMIAAAMLAVAGAIALIRKQDVRAFLVAGGAVVAAILPWRIWVAAHGIEVDLPLSKGLRPDYLLDRIDRVRPAFEAVNQQMAEQGRWLYLLPLAILVITACAVSGIGRRPALFYLGSGLLAWAAFIWGYWISPYELAWHLSTSVDRVVDGIMFICVAAILHLSGILIGALSEPSSTASAAPGARPPGRSAF
jgi:hypothetical protein